MLTGALKAVSAQEEQTNTALILNLFSPCLEQLLNILSLTAQAHLGKEAILFICNFVKKLIGVVKE